MVDVSSSSCSRSSVAAIRAKCAEDAAGCAFDFLRGRHCDPRILGGHREDDLLALAVEGVVDGHDEPPDLGRDGQHPIGATDLLTEPAGGLVVDGIAPVRTELEAHELEAGMAR